MKRAEEERRVRQPGPMRERRENGRRRREGWRRGERGN